MGAFLSGKPLARRVVQWQAYADEVDKKAPFDIVEVRPENCTKISKGGHSRNE